jgi:hypothetical protein
LFKQPADDREHSLARLRAGELLPFTHLADDGRVFQNALRQFGLAQAVPAMQMLAKEIAKWVTQGGLLPHNSVCHSQIVHVMDKKDT